MVIGLFIILGIVFSYFLTKQGIEVEEKQHEINASMVELADTADSKSVAHQSM